MNQNQSLAQMVKAAQQGILTSLGRGTSPAAQEKVAEDDYATKLAGVNRALAAVLRKHAEATSPGVSQAITDAAPIPEDTGHSSAKPGLTRSSLTTKTEPNSAAASPEVSHSIGNKTAEEKSDLKAKLQDFAKKHPNAAEAVRKGLVGGMSFGAMTAALSPKGSRLKNGLGSGAITGAAVGISSLIGKGGTKKASEGAGALPESTADQDAGQPIGGKPKGPTHLVSSNQAAINATSKDTYRPREEQTAPLLSQRMNANDHALSKAFKNHDGAKTAGFASFVRRSATKTASAKTPAPSHADLSVKTASAAEILRRLEAQVNA